MVEGQQLGQGQGSGFRAKTRGQRISMTEHKRVCMGYATVISRQRDRIKELDEKLESRDATIARLHKLIDRLQPVEVDA